MSRELLFSRKSCDVTPSEQPCSRPQLAARGPSRRRRSRHPAARKGAGDESRARRPPRASDACDRARDRRARTARAHLEIQIRIRWVTRLARLAARRGRMSSDGSTSRGSPHRAPAWTTPRRRGRYANVPTLHPTWHAPESITKARTTPAHKRTTTTKPRQPTPHTNHHSRPRATSRRVPRRRTPTQGWTSRSPTSSEPRSSRCSCCLVSTPSTAVSNPGNAPSDG